LAEWKGEKKKKVMSCRLSDPVLAGCRHVISRPSDDWLCEVDRCERHITCGCTEVTIGVAGVPSLSETTWLGNNRTKTKKNTETVKKTEAKCLVGKGREGGGLVFPLAACSALCLSSASMH
jgi:hypothetical protein